MFQAIPWFHRHTIRGNQRVEEEAEWLTQYYRNRGLTTLEDICSCRVPERIKTEVTYELKKAKT